MPACSPQRFLANNRNLVREAILSPSSVLPIEGYVIGIPTARKGTAQAQLTGAYDGVAEATYDVQIVDTASTNPLISAPVASGEGSGKLSGISSTLDPQKITVQLNDDGLPTTTAALAFEGVSIISRAAGAAGNDVRIDIDQSPLAFSDTAFSLLQDIKAGQGSPDSGLSGPAFDWDTAVLGADNVIPSGAHRVAFGDDTSRIYLQYKKFAAGAWSYYFVPALLADIPAGTKVKFVTGGRVVTVGNGVTTETYSGVVTDYDLLNALQTTSALVAVDGVVSNDRSPTGQASRELSVRTDAHCDISTGSGSNAAQGFVSTFAGADANTELVTATCYAASPKDHPQAHLGAERWTLEGSVSGPLGDIVTDVAYTHPDGLFGLTIPTRLPNGFGAPKGTFSVTAYDYVARAEGVEDPPLCLGDMVLGAAASDQTITLKWTKRPSGACDCVLLPFDHISDSCLGLETEEGGSDVSYSADALPRAKALMDWASTLAAACTRYTAGHKYAGVPDAVTTNTSVDGTASLPASTQGGMSFVTEGTNAFGQDIPYEEGSKDTGFGDEALPSNMQSLLDDYEKALQAIDDLTETGLRADGFDKWDDALDAWQADLATSALSGLGNRLASFTTTKYQLMLRRAMIYAGISQLGKSSASSQISGDGCWQDYGDSFYWAVVGSEGGAYAPAFNGHIYYSTRRTSLQDAYYSTKEFAFQVNCACPGQLLEGDTITLSINGSGFGATYQVGDKLTLPVIAAQDLFLAGGQDGNSIQTWNVSGSVDGPLANFVYDPDSPTDYANGSPVSLAFTYTPGGIANVKGDSFTFSIEGGRFKWRKNAGAWSSNILIQTAPYALDDGLSLSFITGAAPSFVAGDTFSFRALQPWAVSNVQKPSLTSWKWAAQSPDSVSLVIDFGSAQTVNMLGIAPHTLPEGSTITVEGGTSPGVYPLSESVTWREGAIAHAMAAPWTARYVRLTIEDSGEAAIGWLWLGDPLSTSLSAEVQRSRKYLISRASGGLYQGGRTLARAYGFDIEWTEAALTEADGDALADLLDWIKLNDDEPFIFVPQIERLEDASLQRVDSDSVEFTDISAYNRGAGFERRYSISLPTSGAWQ